MSEKVFISYSSIDDSEAKKVAKTLENLGVEYFLNCKDIEWGDGITA